MITEQQVQLEFALLEPEAAGGESRVSGVAEAVNDELDAWGHANHEVSVERVIRFYGDPGLLRWTLWCETCHVVHVALLERPAAG